MVLLRNTNIVYFKHNQQIKIIVTRSTLNTLIKKPATRNSIVNRCYGQNWNDKTMTIIWISFTVVSKLPQIYMYMLVEMKNKTRMKFFSMQLHIRCSVSRMHSNHHLALNRMWIFNEQRKKNQITRSDENERKIYSVSRISVYRFIWVLATNVHTENVWISMLATKDCWWCFFLYIFFLFVVLAVKTKI